MISGELPTSVTSGVRTKNMNGLGLTTAECDEPRTVAFSDAASAAD
jgi:hypothetical protein